MTLENPYSINVVTPSQGFSHFSARLKNCSLPGGGRLNPNCANKPPFKNAFSGFSLTVVMIALQQVSLIYTILRILKKRTFHNPRRNAYQNGFHSWQYRCGFWEYLGLWCLWKGWSGLLQNWELISGDARVGEAYGGPTVSHLMLCSLGNGRENWKLGMSFVGETRWYVRNCKHLWQSL